MLSQFSHAAISGVLIATVCSLLGIFVILKRVVFIGMALSEVAACGIAASFILGLHPFAGAASLTLGTVGLLACPFESRRIPRDAVLGVVFVAAAAASILLVSHSGFGLMEIRSLLYGDLILAGPADLQLLLLILVPVLFCFLAVLRPMLDSFLDRETATVSGLRPALWEGLYFVLLGLTVSAASKVTGALLVFCYLVVSPATGLLLSRRFGVALVCTIAAATLGTLAGLIASFQWDLPTNQTICAVCCAELVVAVVWSTASGRLMQRHLVHQP
jgi:zinc transport system permease protein